jgi:hypothetical protein
MASQAWVNLLNAGIPWQSSQGTQLATAVTAVISPRTPAVAQDFVLPGQPNGLQWYPGMSLRLKARGTMASGGTTSSLTVAVGIGPSGSTTGFTTALCSTAAVVLGTGSLAGLFWRLEANVNCVALAGGTATTLTSEGEVIVSDATTPAIGTASAIMLGMAFTSTAFSTYTGGTAMGLNGTLSAAFGNIQCNQFTIEQLS